MAVDLVGARWILRAPGPFYASPVSGSDNARQHDHNRNMYVDFLPIKAIMVVGG